MSDGFCWEGLLDSDADGCFLKAALFTTHEKADERFLAEHFLGTFLRLDHDPQGEGAERTYFLVELDRRLKQLRDRLVVVSSVCRNEAGGSKAAESSTFPWIWGSIRHLFVGGPEHAVQHAKLWLLHWGDRKGDEYIEIVVSSANLTRAGFKEQLQAAWRACLLLNPKASLARRRSWGVLPHFLKELARSARSPEKLDPFIELLARAQCPDGITFVASVPGKHSQETLRRTPWGSAGLRKITPPGLGKVSAWILTPFVGVWNGKGLSRWCAKFGGSPHRLWLVWIDKYHPWASYWTLPRTTVTHLRKNGSSFLQLGYEEGEICLLHAEHRPTDQRWSHAKVYAFKRSASRRLLVTSANFSEAAWGKHDDDGTLTIKNFELGVCINQGQWPLDHLGVFNNPKTDAAVPPESEEVLIAWAQAAWNGKRVNIQCRCKAPQDLRGRVGPNTAIREWSTREGFRSASVPWSSKNPYPSVELTCRGETITVPVFDERPVQEREQSAPPGIDANGWKEVKDKLLFAQYGGREAEESVDGAQNGNGANSPNESYEVGEFTKAREHFRVVDKWSKRMKRASEVQTQDFERSVLLHDGKSLIESFQRQSEREKKNGTLGMGAKLAAEELVVRLKHYRRLNAHN
jgi:hypothetical protein